MKKILFTILTAIFFNCGYGQGKDKITMTDVYALQRNMVPELQVPGDTIPLNQTTQALMLQLERYHRLVDRLDEAINLWLIQIQLLEQQIELLKKYPNH